MLFLNHWYVKMSIVLFIAAILLIVVFKTGLVFRQTEFVFTMVISGIIWNLKSTSASLGVGTGLFWLGLFIISYAVMTTL